MTQLAADDLKRLLAEEPFVRSLARNLSPDHEDVAQQTFLQVLETKASTVEKPRSWLGQVVRNVAANLRRGEDRRAKREHAAAVHDLVPSSAELMEREERRRILVAAVDALPEAQRTVVILRYFEGLPPRKIAAEIGVPVATVWTQLARGLRTLRQRFGVEEDHRLGLLGAVFSTGLIAMTTKTKLAVAAAALLAVAGGFFYCTSGTAAATGGDAPTPKPSELAARGPEETQRSDDEADKNDVRREAVAAPEQTPPEADPTVAGLIVRVRYGDDQQPAPNIGIIVRRLGSEHRVSGWRKKTDATGLATFDALAPGRLYVGNDRGTLGKYVTIEAGETQELQLDLKAGLTLTGIVVDGSDRPIAGAAVEVAPLGRADFDVQNLATTDAAGKFHIRGAEPACLIGARAKGFAASEMQFFFGKQGNTAEVRIVLQAPGGSVSGTVVDPDGKPIADAVVMIGAGQTAGLIARNKRCKPVPALLRTDAKGRFHATGLAVGDHPARARGIEFAPWTGTCSVAAHQESTLRITLAKGATLRGVVRTADGAPVRGAEVEVGQWEDFAHFRAYSAADGSFTLVGLPGGEVQIRADHEKLGKREARVQLVAGTEQDCVLLLGRGVELTGRLVDENNAPVKTGFIDVSASLPGGKYWSNWARPDENGRFKVLNCPKGQKLTVNVRGKTLLTLRRNEVDPAAGELILQVKRTLPPSVHITGRVLDQDGKPVPNAMIGLSAKGGLDTPGIHSTGEDGSYSFGPLVPGEWRVWVRSNHHPEHRGEYRGLAADAKWQVDDIRLVAGGQAEITLRGAQADQAQVRVISVDEKHYFAVQSGSSPRTSSPLEPGSYLALVYGKGIAAQSSTLTIRAGEKAKVAFDLRGGTKQDFLFRAAVENDTELTAGSIRFQLYRGGKLVRRAWAPTQGTVAFRQSAWLLPGSYELKATRGKRAGTARFTVGSAPGTPVQITMK